MYKDKAVHRCGYFERFSSKEVDSFNFNPTFMDLYVLVCITLQLSHNILIT